MTDIPVDGNPFAAHGKEVSVDHDPFAKNGNHGWAMPSISGLANNFAAGTIEGATGALASVSDPGAGDELGALGIEPHVKMGTPDQAQHGINLGLGKLGLNPEDVPTNSGMEQIFREGGRFALAAFGGEAGIINRAARVIGPSIGATVGKEVAGAPGEIVGGLAGGGLTAFGEGAYNAASHMADLHTMTPGNRAMALLERSMERDRTPPEAADAALERFGDKPVTVADVGGPATARLARTVAALPGTGSSDFLTTLAERSGMEQHRRVVNDIATHLADGRDIYNITENLAKSRATAAAPLYDVAFNSARPVWTPRIQEFINDPELRPGIIMGLKIQRLEALEHGVPFRPSDYAIAGFDEAGEPIINWANWRTGGDAQDVPNLRTLDAAKVGLDQMLERYRDTTTGKLFLDKFGKALNGVRKAYVAELDRVAPPEYKAARAAWSGPSQSMDAVAMGRDFLDADPEQIDRIMKGMSPGDRDFYRIGAGRALQERVGSAMDNRDATERVFGTDQIRKQITAAFGPEAATNFASQSVTPERMMAATNRFVTGNSATVNKALDIQDTAGPLENTFRNVAESGVRKGIMRTIDLPTRISRYFNQLTPETVDELSRLLSQRERSGLVNRAPLALDAAGGQGGGIINRISGVAQPLTVAPAP